MRLTLTGTALLLAATSVWADSADSSFMKDAAASGMAEVEMGQLAQEKASKPDVKSYAAMLVKDHTSANEKLKALAASSQVSLPDGPTMMQKASKAKLGMMSGDSFDKSYVKSMIEDHKEDIKLFEKEATNGKDPRAKAFAVATLPTLKKHLEHVQSMAGEVGAKDD